MVDLAEVFANGLSKALIGSVVIEWGMSSWQQRTFSKKCLWGVFLVVIGARIALTGL